MFSSNALSAGAVLHRLTFDTPNSDTSSDHAEFGNINISTMEHCMDDDDDDESFLSYHPPDLNAASSNRVNTNTGNKSMILSIASSDDDDDNDDDDDDIATLRASQSFVHGEVSLLDDDTDNRCNHPIATQQEIHVNRPESQANAMVGDGVWSQLTTSPFTTPAVKAQQSRNHIGPPQGNTDNHAKIITASLSSNKSEDTNHHRPSLNLSKVRQSNKTNVKGSDSQPTTTNHNNKNTVLTKKASTSSKSILEVTAATTTPSDSPVIVIPSKRNTNMRSSSEHHEQVNKISDVIILKQEKQARAEVKRTKDRVPQNGICLDKKEEGIMSRTDKRQNNKLESDRKSTNDTKCCIDNDVPTKKQKKGESKTNVAAIASSLSSTSCNKKQKNQQEVNNDCHQNASIHLNDDSIGPVVASNCKHSSNSDTTTKTTNKTSKQKSSVDKNIEPNCKSSNDSNHTMNIQQVAVSTKPKPKKLSFQDQVMVHMLHAFKPFTLRSLTDEMKMSSESSVNFVLLSLIDKGLVIQKDFTSTKGRVKTLFWANHGNTNKVKEVNIGAASTMETMVVSKEDRDTAQQKLVELRNKLAALRNQYQQVLQQPSNDDLTHLIIKEESALTELYQRRDEIQRRIQESQKQATVVPSTTMKRTGFILQSQKSKNVVQQCPIRLKKRINHFREEWKIRKTKCMDFVEQLADGLEKKTKDVIQLLDIDTDEMNHAVIPAKYPIS